MAEKRILVWPEGRDVAVDRTAAARTQKGASMSGRLGRIGLAVVLALACGVAEAGTFGVPGNLAATGQACIGVNDPAGIGCTAASTRPPGYFILRTTGGTAAVNAAAGDTVHQIRFFVEVTGTTLDIRVFDADSNNDRDYNGTVNTEYRLYNPAGTQVQLLTIAGTSAATNNRLARFHCDAGWENLNVAAPNYFGQAGCTNGATITPGRYEFRVTINDNGTAQYNAFGIDVRDSAGNPYNVYVEPDSTAPDSSMVIGALNTTSGTYPANITPPMTFYPFVDRGCSIETSNFDMDATGTDAAVPLQNGQGAYALLTDALGATAPSLTMSGFSVHSEDNVTVEATNLTNLDIHAYGMYTLANGPASQQNIVDWRVADWNGWNDNPANLPRDPASPLRLFLPNSPCPVYGTCPAVTDPPASPVLTASARVCSSAACSTAGGTNPPRVGQTTGFQMFASLYNPGPAAITNVQIYGGATTNRVTYRGQPRCYLDGVEIATGCTFTQPAAGTLGPFSVDALYTPALAVGHWIGFSYEVELVASGLDNLSAAPGELNTIRATYTAFATGSSRTENLGPLCQVPINIGDVSLTKTVDPATVEPGGLLTYTITVTAAGNASDVYWTEDLSAGTTFVSLTNPDTANWTCTTPAAGAAGVVSCSTPSLADGVSRAFTLVVRVDPAYPVGSLTNNVVVGAAGDTNLANNQASVSATVTAPPTLRVGKAASVSSIVTLNDFTYTITVTNSSPTSAVGVQMSDTLPANVSFRSIAIPAGWTCPTLPAVGATGPILCRPNPSPPGNMATGTATFTVTVRGGAVGAAVNTASVTSTTPGGTSNGLPVTTRVLATAPTTAVCATPGRDGSLTVTDAVAPNTYYPGNATAAAGATTITLGAARGGSVITAGDLVLVMQMQDAAIDSSNDDTYGGNNGTGRGSTALNNTGRYQFVRAVSLVGATLTVTPALTLTYTNAAATATAGQRRFQVIRVPQYTNVTFGTGASYGTLTALPWNGTTGGVLAIDVAGTITLSTDAVRTITNLVTSYPPGNNTATATTSAAHDFGVGDLVTIAGANQAPYNGTFAVLAVPSATQFTYRLVDQHVDARAPASPVSPATGTITVTRHPVNVSGRGFRGGGGRTLGGEAGLDYTDYRTPSTDTANGSKGEGIAGTPQYVLDPLDPRTVTDTGVDGYPNGSSARGAPGNAGGGSTDGNPDANDENSGGGGGGNGGVGGLGGNSWNTNYANGGIGGDTYTAAADRMAMGGGGGAGTRNNSFTSASSGGAGGGIVFVRSGAFAGTGAVLADGAQGVEPENDGGGGGGAGGTILLAAAQGGLAGVTAWARGARGTNAWPTIVAATTFPNERHGPGGGGGGGWVLTTSAPAAVDVSGGAPGFTSTVQDTYGTAPGAPGRSATITWAAIPGVDAGGECSADLAIAKSAALVSTTRLVYTLVVTNNGFADAAAATVNDTLPSGTTYLSANTTLGTCSYAPATRLLSCNLGTLARGASATIAVELTPPASGTLTNTGTTASTTTDPVSTNNSSTAVTTITPQTDLAVDVTAPADPITADSDVTYTVLVRNLGANAAPDATLTLPIPVDTTFQAVTPPSGWACTSPAVGSGPPAVVTCTRASAPVDAAGVTFSLRLAVPAGTPAGTVVTQTARVSTTGYDIDASNDADAASNTVGPVPQLLTRATIAGLRVDPRSGLVEFATGFQAGTVSFDVFATDHPEGEGDLVKLNDEPIRAPRPDSTTPTLYQLRTRPFAQAYVVIEERDTKGRSRAMGPFSVRSRHLRRAYEWIETRATGGGETIASGAGGQSTALTLSPRRLAGDLRSVHGRGRVRRPGHRPRPAQLGIRIPTSGAGLAEALRSDLEAAGLPVSVGSHRLRLTNRGRPVPFEIVGSGSEERLRFLADSLATPYTGDNAYILTWRGAANGPAVGLTTPEPPVPAGVSRVRRHTLYLQTAPLDVDPWFWDALVDDGRSWPSPEMLEWFPGLNLFDLDGLQPGEGDAAVRIAFWTGVAGRHSVTATINGLNVGDTSFEGNGAHVLVGRVPRAALQAAGNTLTLTYRGQADAPDDWPYVALRHIEIDGVADVRQARALVRSPEVFDTALPNLNGVQYLIVTHPAFTPQANQIAQLKRAAGLRTAVVETDRAYDRYSAGVVEANAIHQLLRHAARGGTLRHVLLVGGDTFDPRDFMATGAVSHVPSLSGWDGEFGRIPSENRYADLDADGLPDVAIGRLPARTEEEADVLVAKIRSQQAVLQAAARRHLFAVDNTPLFRNEARATAAFFPAAQQSWADLGAGWEPARASLFHAWEQGVALTHYFGHGSPQQWADELLVDAAEAGSVRGPASVFLTWTCSSQFYQFLWGRSVNEAFLLNRTGGALASFGPAGIADVSLQAPLYRKLYDELRAPGTSLGEAVRRAKVRALGENEATSAAVEGFNLLGDPALVLPPLGAVAGRSSDRERRVGP